jgi:hypothetical protein
VGGSTITDEGGCVRGSGSLLVGGVASTFPRAIRKVFVFVIQTTAAWKTHPAGEIGQQVIGTRARIEITRFTTVVAATCAVRPTAHVGRDYQITAESVAYYTDV